MIRCCSRNAEVESSNQGFELFGLFKIGDIEQHVRYDECGELRVDFYASVHRHALRLGEWEVSSSVGL